jgi:hypothetical protein
MDPNRVQEMCSRKFVGTEFSEIRQENALKGTKFIADSSPLASVGALYNAVRLTSPTSWEGEGAEEDEA